MGERVAKPPSGAPRRLLHPFRFCFRFRFNVCLTLIQIALFKNQSYRNTPPSCKDGKEDGLLEFFNEDGSLEKTETYINGVKKNN